MHDLIFKNIRKMKRPDLEAHAKTLGLDMVKFKEALDKGTYKAQVDADMKEGGTVKVTGTPSIFINGRRVRGIKFDQLKPVIDEELENASLREER